MWVVQEILLAQNINILCDQYLITWSAFCKDLRTYAATHRDIYTRTCALEFDLARHQVGSKSLISLLHTYGRSVCREFKDKIFALLSLLPYRERLTLDKYFPNYSLSNDEVRMITLRHIRSQSPEYDVLTLMNDKILQEALRIKSSIVWDRLVFGWNFDDDLDIECNDDNHLDCDSSTSDYDFDSEVDSVDYIAGLKTKKAKRNLKRSEPATDRFNEHKSNLSEDSYFGLLYKLESSKRKLKQVKRIQAQAIGFWS